MRRMKAGKLMVNVREIIAVNIEKAKASDLVLREMFRKPSRRVLESFSFRIMGLGTLFVPKMMEKGSYPGKMTFRKAGWLGR